MKTFKRIQAFLLAMVLAIFSTGTTAFAAETNENSNIDSNIVDVTINENGYVETTYEFEVTPDKMDSNGIALLSADVDQSFTMTSSHRGSSRSYSGRFLNVTMSATDTNGNAVNTILAARFCDHNTEDTLFELQCSANGQPRNLYDFSITSGKLYYFQYLIAYGTQQTIRVHMVITSHN